MSSRSLSLGDLCHGAIAGAVGGLAASWVMNQFIIATQRRAEQADADRSERQQARQPNSSASSPQQQKETRQRQSEGGSDNGGGEDATVKTAELISRNLFDHELSQKEKEVAGPIVHYAYGALIGSVYGAVAEAWPAIATGFGMPYGVAVWALGDEIAVPALRLGPPPAEVPAEKHADFTRRVARHVV